MSGRNDKGQFADATAGHCTHSYASPTFNSWRSMMQRVYLSSHEQYPNYGGRGIAVCARWQSFEEFLTDMGERPAGHTLDRQDVNADYGPGNCRWATEKAQQRNRRNNRLITFKGVTRSLAEWSELTGILAKTLSNRLGNGWPVERAMTEAVTNRRPWTEVRRPVDGDRA